MEDPVRLTTMKRDVTYHAFNLSNAEVNGIRTNQFVSLLAVFERAHNVASRAEALPPWWPQNGVDMLEAIKREREEMDTLGYIQSAASRPSEESLPNKSAGESNLQELKRERHQRLPSANVAPRLLPTPLELSISSSTSDHSGPSLFSKATTTQRTHLYLSRSQKAGKKEHCTQEIPSMINDRLPIVHGARPAVTFTLPWQQPHARSSSCIADQNTI